MVTREGYYRAGTGRMTLFSAVLPSADGKMVRWVLDTAGISFRM